MGHHGPLHDPHLVPPLYSPPAPFCKCAHSITCNCLQVIKYLRCCMCSLFLFHVRLGACLRSSRPGPEPDMHTSTPRKRNATGCADRGRRAVARNLPEDAPRGVLRHLMSLSCLRTCVLLCSLAQQALSGFASSWSSPSQLLSSASPTGSQRWVQATSQS